MLDLLDPLFDLIATLLAWFYGVWPSYGAAIAILTLTLMIVSTPLTLKGIRSMLQMQEYSAELKKIQKEHRGDRAALNEATMAFYKEHGINPMGSCLPMLIQAPLFLVLYYVVRGLTRRSTEIGTQLGFTIRPSAGGGFETLTYSNTPIARDELTFDPDFLSRGTDLYASLSESREMVSLGIDLSREASDALSEGVVEALPYFAMLILVFVTGLYQQHQIQRRQKGVVINKQQQMIMKIIPYFLPVVSYTIPAAVVVYFIVSALYRIAQQAYITKSYYTGDDSLGARAARQRSQAAAESGGTRAKSGTSKSPASKSATGQKSAAGQKSATGQKGAAAPRRDARTAHARAPVRKQAAGRAGVGSSSSGPAKAGRTGKAPSRSRSAASRNRSESGRTTQPGTRTHRNTQNRSRSKKKRR